MKPGLLFGALGALALLAAGAAGLRAAPDLLAPVDLPPPAADVPETLAQQELCAAVIEADGRQASARLAAGDDPGAGFALRNDGFRSDWLLLALQHADPTRDWRARIDAVGSRLPADARAAALSSAYVRCLQAQNRDPAFTAALHAYLPYTDAR